MLSLDADERVSPALREEIGGAIAAGDADAYRMPRLSTFCGRAMRHSGWYPDYVLRLFRRTRGASPTTSCTSTWSATAPSPGSRNRCCIFRSRKLEDALSRMDRYSTAGAELLVASGKPVSFMTGIAHGLYAFLKTYVLRAGFLDGREGFLLAVANAEGTYYRYMKAWLMRRSNG